jgi:glycosyltransferase involved in cell wall biosynthesis
MPEPGPAISVIVPHLNQPIFLENCLSSLDNQTLDRACFEVIVVDNGSAQLPSSVLAKHPSAKLLQESKPGPGMARNRGVTEAKGRIFAFIDADCRAHPDWLKVALAAISGSAEGTVLGGDVQIWRNRKDAFSATEAYESVFAYRFKLYIEQRGFSGTGNLVVRQLISTRSARSRESMWRKIWTGGAAPWMQDASFATSLK